jgi:hypothetical protein
MFFTYSGFIGHSALVNQGAFIIQFASFQLQRLFKGAECPHQISGPNA